MTDNKYKYLEINIFPLDCCAHRFNEEHVSDFFNDPTKKSIFTCIPLNALSDNLRIALCEKSSFFIGKFDVAKVYLWSSIVHVFQMNEESVFCWRRAQKSKRRNYKH